MTIRIVLPVVLAAVAVAASPASANWFANAALGINRCICSAPSPTPEQVRLNRMPPFVLHEQAEPVSVTAAAQTQQTPAAPVTVAQAAAQTQQAPAR